VVKDNIHTNCTKRDVKTIHQKIERVNNKRAISGHALRRYLVLIDDMAGTDVIHGGRISPFANLSIMTPHLDLSMIVITQQPTCVSPAFRNNAELIVIFPSDGDIETEWLKRSYQSLMMDSDGMKAIILKAWRGGKPDNSEWGKHFLAIEATPRSHTRFWIDFTKQIKYTEK
jgi:hypothetical protein